LAAILELDNHQADHADQPLRRIAVFQKSTDTSEEEVLWLR
jgi:hypothetical protein